MAVIKKQKSISRLFTRYLALFCSFTVLLVIIDFSAFFGAVNAGYLLPANYYEKVVESKRTEIAKAGKVKDVMPEGCRYAVYNSEGKVFEKNVSLDDAQEMWNIIKNDQAYRGDNVYKYIERKDGICIVSIKLKAEFSNPVLRKCLPNAEDTVYAVLIALFIIGVFVLARMFSKNVSKEMDILKQITEKIDMENLDFNVQYSSITEINDVIYALDRMKGELSSSLKKQWKMEEIRKSQISALAHDIKTPLTIIKGNSELLDELSLTDEQKEFNDSILKESDNIEFYIKSLIDINKSQQAQISAKDKINSKEFIGDIIKQGSFMCLSKNIKFKKSANDVCSYFIGDINQMKRAVMNVLSNAVRYAPKKGTILFSVYNDDKYMHFIVEDSGRGFSEEEIRLAAEEFYQGDKSRNSKNHYGMGLYITKIFAENHGGDIKLMNSEYLGGAKVEIFIPI